MPRALWIRIVRTCVQYCSITPKIYLHTLAIPLANKHSMISTRNPTTRVRIKEYFVPGRWIKMEVNYCLKVLRAQVYMYTCWSRAVCTLNRYTGPTHSAQTPSSCTAYIMYIIKHIVSLYCNWGFSLFFFFVFFRHRTYGYVPHARNVRLLL